MKCVSAILLLAWGTTALVHPGTMHAQRTSSTCAARRGLRRKRISFTLKRCKSQGDDDREATDEGVSPHTLSNVEPSTEGDLGLGLDAEIEELLQGFNFGSFGTTVQSEAARKKELDEMKLILALRRKMGEEDFYAIFDPRNRLIGDL